MRSFIKVSNTILDTDLSHNELAVYVYLCTIYGRQTCLYGGRWVRVKQMTIAAAVGIKNRATIAKIVSSLINRGLITAQARSIHKGVYSYAVADCHASGGYFKLDRNIFKAALSPRELHIYLFMCKCTPLVSFSGMVHYTKNA